MPDARLSPYCAVVVSSVQLLGQSSVGFSQQDELLVEQEDLLLQLLTAAELQAQRTNSTVTTSTPKDVLRR